MSLQARIPKLSRHREGAEQALGFPEAQAKLNAATPRLKTFLVPKRQCSPPARRKKGEGMQKCLSTLMSLTGQAYKNLPFKTQKAQQSQVQPEAWLAGSRAVPCATGLKSPRSLSVLALTERRSDRVIPSLLFFFTSFLHTAVKRQA